MDDDFCIKSFVYFYQSHLHLKRLRNEFLVMAKIHWKVSTLSGRLLNWLRTQYSIIKLTFLSLFYNDFADKYYIGDTTMEPMFWFVDHFTKILGPVCVIGVIVLTSSVIVIAYAIGLPFYLKQGTFTLITALTLGHWILINVVFYYYMSYVTEPGYPPQGAMITEAVSICKKCIAPKPPRTHHCSVCNRCVLKMDHHCPWLNNCIGHFNHRYFFMFCSYAWIGVIFVMGFGLPIAYEHFFGNPEQETLYSEDLTSTSVQKRNWSEALYHSCIVYAALLCIAVFFVLGGLLAWHSHLISKGETSIEGHINKKERARLSKEGKVYKNIYDFGPRANWKLFLGIYYKRSWWHILLPFIQEPYGDGLQWETQSDIDWLNETLKKKNFSKTCSIKLS